MLGYKLSLHWCKRGSMLNPEDVNKSYFDMMAESAEEVEKSCSKTSEDIKSAIKTISYSTARMKSLLDKLKDE